MGFDHCLAIFSKLNSMEYQYGSEKISGADLLVAKENADKAGFNYESIFKGITLKVHSSLEAVGLTAAVSNKLAEKGISANVIAAYYHDHIFVQAENADAALSALNEFSR